MKKGTQMMYDYFIFVFSVIRQWICDVDLNEQDEHWQIFDQRECRTCQIRTEIGSNTVFPRLSLDNYFIQSIQIHSTCPDSGIFLFFFARLWTISISDTFLLSEICRISVSFIIFNIFDLDRVTSDHPSLKSPVNTHTTVFLVHNKNQQRVIFLCILNQITYEMFE